MPSPLAIQGLHHVAITTADVPRSVAFYRDLLGFREIPRPNFSFRGAWLQDATSDLQIHIIEHPEPTRLIGEIDTKTNHFALAVADLDAAETWLQERHVEYRRQVNAGGYQQIFIRDPDGNHVELGAYPATITGDEAITGGEPVTADEPIAGDGQIKDDGPITHDGGNS